ncbi:MAG: porin family protein [Alphaproteobacteria bacterium]|nr:porin family protein [Alphaproteobacteria bacterium]
MKKISLLTVALIAGFAGVSKAEISQYTSAHISYTKAKVEGKDHDGSYDEMTNKATPALSVAYGLNFGKGLRSDVEFTYGFNAKETESYEDDEGSYKDTYKTNQMSLMLNGYYDIATGTKWTPYVNLGIGMSKQTIKYKGVDLEEDEVETGKASDTTFTWQAGLGVSYEVANNLSVDAGYRYVDYGKPKDTAEDFEGKTKANVLSIGARYAF